MSHSDDRSQADKITEVERRGNFGYIAALFFFLGLPAAFVGYLKIQAYLTPLHSAETYLYQNETKVVANYYSDLIDSAGQQYVTVERKDRKVSLQFANRDWLSDSKIDVYTTPERYIGLKAADVRWFIIDPSTMKVTTSALPYFASWNYVGSFDFVGPQKRGNFKFMRSIPTQ